MASYVPEALELDDQTQIAIRQENGHLSFMGQDNVKVGDGSHLVQQLKPVDGGFEAWRLLITAFVFEALFWGFPTSFGVFQNYYSTLPEFAGKTSSIALIGSIAQALSYLGAPFSTALAKRYPKYQRQQIWIGVPMCILGLLAASFCNTIAGLVATQGFLYGFGFVTFTFPVMSMINEWWIARKGMAFGLISAASGATGAVMPFIIDAMLNKYGYRTTLRACAVAMFILTAPLLPFLKGRLPATERSALPRTNWTFVKKPLFWIYCLSMLIQGLGFFFPSLYLPSYAAVIGLRPQQGAALLAVMSVSQVLGQFTFGYLSDKTLPVSALAVLCSTVSTIAVLAIWGLAKSLTLLVFFSIIYGFFAYGFGAMRVAMGRAFNDDPSGATTTFSILIFIQGIGNVLAGPLSTVLVSGNISFHAYGALRYKSLILFTGACMFLSALVIGLWQTSRLLKGFSR